MEKCAELDDIDLGLIDACKELARTDKEYLLSVGYTESCPREKALEKLFLQVQAFVLDSESLIRDGTIVKRLSIFVRAPHSDEDSPRAHKEGF